MANPVSKLGFRTLRFVEELGGMAAFAADVTRTVVAPPPRLASFSRELFKLGVLSLIIICVCGLTVGMVLGLQGHHTLVRYGATQSLGAVVGLSLIRELGPVITALLVAGRAGSATAAEIASMVTTQQLDGLRMLSIDPVSFVIKPKAMAMQIVTPLLTAMFICCGLYGGYLIGVGVLGGDAGSYMGSLKSAVDFRNDIACCLVKSVVFGFFLGLIATYRGYTSVATAEGVSAATTSSVVISSVTVLLADYVITALWGI
ncbi:MAG TPA: MlaE family lipid ABC transporter permease subunit [Tepidisphaeraceae bacterium]|jgi:phospholipid/cholesterol/gamma-HCH transport system permease protein|nr:MlaE family lipid ABC transporter permease subunit [Tepidisphaeraceae bacterium]